MKCPKCESIYSYQVGSLWTCPECAHEWTDLSLSADQDATTLTNDSELLIESIKDASGTILHEGDQVTVIKDLKIKGTSSVVKVGTKVKNIHLVESSDGHNIACRIEGIGSINLKSEFVRKV
jgi:protein PhnA